MLSKSRKRRIKMRKRSFIICWVLFAAMILVACKKQESNLPVQDIMDDIETKVSADQGVLSGEELNWDRLDLCKEEGNIVREMIGLRQDLIAEGIYFANPSKEKSDRIILLKAKTKKEIEQIVDCLEEMQDAQEEEWEYVSKQEYEKVENAVIETKERYVMYLVYDNPASIKKIIEDRLE